jgi:hypothetical protein
VDSKFPPLDSTFRKGGAKQVLEKVEPNQPLEKVEPNKFLHHFFEKWF